jgi:hypothetical protein
MKAIYVIRSMFAAGILLGLALTGCALASAAKPVAVINSPPSGTQVDENSEVQVQVNASDSQGITRIDLLVNGVVVASESAPTAGGQPTFSAVLRWTPTTLGEQVVEARAYNVKGDVSAPVGVNILVRQAQASTTGTPTSVPTAAPSPSDTTAPGTDTPTSTPQPAITVIVQPQQPSQPSKPSKPQQPQAPAAPSNFEPNGSGTTIKFTWKDNSNDEKGFHIYQEDTADHINGPSATPPVVTLPAHNGTGGMSYDWISRPCGLKAAFYIRAYNDAGESAPSNSATAVSIPCVPANLTGYHQTAVHVQFNWSVSDPHNEDGFRMYRSGVANPFATRGPNLGSGGTFWDIDLPCDVDNYFTVRAFNAAGETADSNRVLLRSLPCSPTNFQITQVIAGSLTNTGSIHFSFTNHSAIQSGFHVYRDDAYYGIVNVPGLVSTVTGSVLQKCLVLVPQTHSYSVRAFNELGESGSSEHVNATQPPCG